MNRNTNIFAYNRPYLDMSRSKFRRNFDHKTTMNAGRLIPIYVDEMLPADSVKLNLGSLIRMSTPIFPVMDQCYMDIYFFAVPERLTYDHFNEMMGENKTDYWTQEVEYELPTIKNNQTGGWKKGSIADYMGIPTGVNLEVRADFFRAMTLVYNEWFRDENVVEPQHLYTDDTNRTITDEQVDAEQCEFGLEPPKVAKFADYFTTALPNAQKGEAVKIPLGTMAPVETHDREIDTTGQYLKFKDANNNDLTGFQTIHLDTGRLSGHTSSTITGGVSPVPSNLYANLAEATSADINQLRQAFAVQKMFERDAIGGK